MESLEEQWTSTAGSTPPSQCQGEIPSDGLGWIGIIMIMNITIIMMIRAWGEITEEYGVGSPKEISQDQPHPGVAPPDEDNVRPIKSDGDN